VSTRAHCQEEPTYFDSLKKRVQFSEAKYFGNTHVLIYQAFSTKKMITSTRLLVFGILKPLNTGFNKSVE